MDEVIKKVLGIKDKTKEYEKYLMVGGGTRGGPVLHHGKGVRVWDTNDKSYIDCTSQSWALYLGYCNQELWNAIDEQSHYLTHAHQGFDTLPKFYLAKKLAEIAPSSLNRVSFSPSSGLAVESAMKIALKNSPGSHYFICLWDAYHGTTLGTMGATWVSTKAGGKYIGGSRFLPLTRNFVRVPNPYCYRCYFGQKPESCNLMCAGMLELTIKKGVNGPPAGLIVEPLQASGGMIPCPEKYLKKIRAICDKYKIPLIFDEIQTYMRIGKFFASEYYGVTPDIISLGKALGGGLPLGATIIKDKLEGFKPDTEEQHTFSSNTLSIVGAIKLIEIVERNNLLENTNKMGNRFNEGLVDLRNEFPEIGDIRQKGLHIGVEFVKDPESKIPLFEETIEIRKDAMNRGVIFGLGGVRKNVLKIKPPLIIKEKEVDEVLEILKASLKTVLRGVKE